MTGLVVKNIFAVLTADDDDDDEPRQVKVHEAPKGKAPIGDKQQPKKPVVAKPEAVRNVVYPGEGGDLPGHLKEDATKYKNKREPRPVKGVPEGHTLDRRSGTGRVDKPRKEDAKKGNAGELRDHNPRFSKPDQKPEEEANPEPAQPPAPVEPPKPTLSEYYKSKGIEVELALESQAKTAKKLEVNADWVKKDGLTLIESKRNRPEEAQQPKKQRKKNSNKDAERNEADDLVVGLMPGERPKQPEPASKSHQRRDPKLRDEDFPAL